MPDLHGPHVQSCFHRGNNQLGAARPQAAPDNERRWWLCPYCGRVDASQASRSEAGWRDLTTEAVGGCAPQHTCREAKRAGGSRGGHSADRSTTHEAHRRHALDSSDGSARTSPWPWGSSRGMGNGPSMPVAGRSDGQSVPTGKSGRTDDRSRPRRDNTPRQGKVHRSRSAAQAPVNPGSPERMEERAMGPDQEGTKSPPPEAGRRSEGPDQEGTRSLHPGAHPGG